MTDHAPTLGTACPAARCTNTLREEEDGQYLCGACLRHLRRWLGQIPAQMTVLRALRQRARGEGGRAGTRTAPLPGDETVLNLLGPAAWGRVRGPLADQCGPQPIAWTIGQWVRLVCEERRLNGPDVWSEENLAAWLDRHLDWAARQPWAPELREEIGDMAALIRRTTGVNPQTRAVPRPCPGCGARELTRLDGEEYAECGACERLYTDGELCDDAPATLGRIAREEREAVA